MPRYKFMDIGIQSMVNVCQVPGIIVRVSLRNSGELEIQVYNALEELNY